MPLMQAERRLRDEPVPESVPLPANEPGRGPAISPAHDPAAALDPQIPSYWEWLKIPVSMWLIFHVAALCLYPASVGNPPRELLATIRDRVFERYMELLFMTGGHRFFAPEPGSSALVQYKLEHPDGRVTEGIFPHRNIRPRLLYHRYFMLSERPFDVADRRAWHRMYARHLAYWFDAERVTIWRVVHRLPDPSDVIAGKPLNAPEFYDYEAIGSWTREELETGPLLPERTEAAETSLAPAAPPAEQGPARDQDDPSTEVLP